MMGSFPELSAATLPEFFSPPYVLGSMPDMVVYR
jgi:hypothetical protein